MQNNESQRAFLPRLFTFTGPLLIAFGSIVLVWIGWLTWYDIAFWGKDVASIFFGSRTGEVISLGIGMQLIHYLLIGLALQLSGLHLTRSTGKPDIIKSTEATKDEETLCARARILPTNMVKRKTVFLKPRFDKTVINIVAEKLKDKLFTRIGFIRTKPSEVQLTSIEKYYEQYLVVKGKYSLEHYKSLVYTLKVDKKARDVFILNEKLKPEPSGDLRSNGNKVIKLTGVSSYHYADEDCCILDVRGREVDPEKLGAILNEEWPKETLTNSNMKKKFSKTMISQEEEISFLRSKIVKRPPDVGEVIKEIFEINERTIINSPMYKLTFENIKTGKDAIVKINGINGDIISTTFNKTISGKFIEDLIKSSHKDLLPINPESVETSSTMISDNAGKDVTDSSEVAAKPVTVSQTSEVEDEEETVEFPAQVRGDVLHVGDRVTAIVGDLEIPSGTTVYETLVVKGDLIIGEKCKMFGTVKALGSITIGANTIIKGNVVSARNVSVGSNVRVFGRVVIGKAFHSESSIAQGSINE